MKREKPSDPDDSSTPLSAAVDDISFSHMNNFQQDNGVQNGKFLGHSVFLFLDTVIVSLGGWLYWIVISKLATTADIGTATTIYSIVVFASTLTQLGLEYPLLKKSNIRGSKVLGTALSAEIAITTVSLLIVILIINLLYAGSLRGFIGIASFLLFLYSIEFIVRFFLLGVSSTKTVLLFDLIGVSIKFTSGYLLVSNGYGALGILIAYLLDLIFLVTAYLLITARRGFTFSLGKLEFFKEILKDALINAPAKWSKVIIINLSVVLLALVGISNSDIGLFYVALTITIFAGSFASGMAYMVIPASSSARKDLSSDSLRISLSFISPFIVALLVAPKPILSLVGASYEPAADILWILALSVLPYSITVNVITKLNNLGKSRNLICIGVTQLAVFLPSFLLISPIYGTLGSAIAILLSFISTSAVSIIWFERSSLRYIISCCLAILIGTIIGLLAYFVLGQNSSPIFALAASIVTSIAIILISKNTSVAEIRQLVKEILER